MFTLGFTSPRWMQYFHWHQSTAKFKSFTIYLWLKEKNKAVTCNNSATTFIHLINCLWVCFPAGTHWLHARYLHVWRWSRTHACIPTPSRVCVCVHVHAPDLPFLPSLCLTGLSLLPSSSLSRRISLLPAATWSSLTEREGIKDSLISTQIKRHFGFHPTRLLAGLAGPEASVCFL